MPEREFFELLQDVWEEHAVQSRTYTDETRESIEASGSVDSKSLVIGRESTINGWAVAESAVTEAVTKDAQDQYLCEVRRGTRNSKVGRKPTGEVDISP